MINLYASAPFLKKRSVPASRFQAPGPHEDAVAYQDHPDADEAMSSTARSDAQDLALAKSSQNLFGESSCRHRLHHCHTMNHVRIPQPNTTPSRLPLPYARTKMERLLTPDPLSAAGST